MFQRQKLSFLPPLTRLTRSGCLQPVRADGCSWDPAQPGRRATPGNTTRSHEFPPRVAARILPVSQMAAPGLSRNRWIPLGCSQVASVHSKLNCNEALRRRPVYDMLQILYYEGRFMRKIGTLCFLFGVTNAFAWNSFGHMTVAAVALKSLSPAAEDENIGFAQAQSQL